ncbi:MAG TPA: DUF1934 domain-containing protein [Bacillota bacterium]|jgi:uncharacterized beta-barrel protein YwiB (DUF1934 family)|nr:DUF1934 domain-containing protein [Bacillota bacterium]
MKDIMLKIVGKQILGDSREEEDQLELVTEGKYHEKDGTVFLSYDESGFSGMEGCTTSLVIKGDEILMKRCGEAVPLDTEIRFEKGKRFNGYYGTPFGAVEMEVLTNDVVNNISREEPKGSLNIDYHISLRGLSEGRSRLDIEII